MTTNKSTSFVGGQHNQLQVDFDTPARHFEYGY